ncbi:MAG: aldehyde ferredoxin oxidoreductase [Proteobacteria bacterium]|nr:aldehyde ferredoxin oxidoreductase [Pseudomonadota bacterium]
MNGWCGNILIVDLDTKRWAMDHPDPEIYRTYIGGRGLAGFYLKDHITRNYDDPAMPLLFFTGPLVNTSSPTSGRMAVMSRSPLTGTVGDSSVGGSLGTNLKKAGLDGLVIRGKSTDLCGIEISEDGVRITDARHLKGKGAGETFSLLPAKASAAVIGPAAENGVLFSSIIVDGHFAAGRNGIGLVMAAKNLKYISVKGKGRTPVHDPEKLLKAREEIYRLVSASPALSGSFGISKFGTGALYDLMDARRMMPTDNFRKTRFEHAPSMNAAAYKKAYAPKSKGCRGCHIQCKKVAKDGRGIPEFETMSHFSALLSNTDMDCVMEANRICNDMGMDTISAAATLSCYGEIQNKTLEPHEILGLLTDIGQGRDEGALLGRGSARYAKDMGKPEASISVKSQELSAYDPRGALGMALSFALSTRGACHLRAYPISHEILRKPVATDRFSFLGKARIIKISEDANAMADSLTACKFIFFAATLEEYAKVYEAVTGHGISGQDLLKIGDAVCKNERDMNRANGFTHKDDDLPERFFKEPGSSEQSLSIKPIDREAFLKARGAYYKIRGE